MGDRIRVRLLHGLGFAGVLRAIGLPHDDLPLALFLFNVGIEIGQLMIVAVLLSLGWMVRRLSLDRLEPAQISIAAAYAT